MHKNDVDMEAIIMKTDLEIGFGKSDFTVCFKNVLRCECLHWSALVVEERRLSPRKRHRLTD